MKVNLNWRDFEIEDDGEKTGIHVKIRPMNFDMNQKMMALAGQNKNVDGQSMISNDNFSELMKELVKSCAKDLTGLELELEDGERAATIDDMLEFAPLFKYAITIFNQIANISNLSKKEADSLKKS